MEQIKLNLLHYLVKHARIDFKEDFHANINETFNLKPHFRRYIKKVDKDKILTTISVEISRENSPFDLFVEIEGLFELKDWEQSEEKRFIATNNTTAVLFPYLRQAVTTLTSLSGLNPVVLPIINTSTLFKTAAENK